MAAGAGLIAGLALLLGGVTAWFVPVSTKVVAGNMAFGSGVLISAALYSGLIATLGFLAALSLHAAQ